MTFPTLILAALVVASGIYIADQFDERAAWLLAFLVLLGIAFRYRKFGDELSGLLSAQSGNKETNAPPDKAQDVKPANIVVGPTGPITA